MIIDEDPRLYNESLNLKNYNEALVTNWQLVFESFPGIDYFAQSVTIPSITVDGIRVPHKNQRMFVPDNLIEYGQLTVTFIIDEDFENYDILLEEFRKQEKATQGNGNNIRELLHDVSVIRYSSNKVPIAVFKFRDASLTNLGSINYTSTVSEAEVILCDISLNITDMVVERFRKSNELDGTLKCE